MMDPQEKIAKLLGDNNIHTSGSIVSDFDAGRYYVFVPITRDENNRIIPSRKKLDLVADLVRKEGFQIEFMLVDNHRRDIESGLRATLMHSFGDFVRNIYLSIDNNSAYVWIEPKGVVDDASMKSINDRIATFFNQFDIHEVNSELTTNNGSIPGILAFLKVIRLLAPIDFKGLKSELIERKFQIPSDEWLRRRLDSLRKRQKIIRLKNGFFVLTFQGLKDTGTERGAGSPDIGRLLALAHRKL